MIAFEECARPLPWPSVSVSTARQLTMPFPEACPLIAASAGRRSLRVSLLARPGIRSRSCYAPAPSGAKLPRTSRGQEGPPASCVASLNNTSCSPAMLRYSHRVSQRQARKPRRARRQASFRSHARRGSITTCDNIRALSRSASPADASERLIVVVPKRFWLPARRRSRTHPHARPRRCPCEASSPAHPAACKNLHRASWRKYQ